MTTIRVLAPAVAALSLAATITMAQGAPGVKKACAADMQKLCPGIVDRHAARRCVRSHMADVSPDCHKAMEAAMAARAQRKAEAAAGATPPAGDTAPPAAPH